MGCHALLQGIILTQGLNLCLLCLLHWQADSLPVAGDLLKKTKNRTTIWSSNPTPVPISRGSHNSKRYMCPNIHYSTIYNSQDMEATKCPSTEEGIKKTRNIYTMKYYSAIKKNEIISFAATWLYLEIILLSEVNQTKTIHLYMDSREKMIQMNLSTKQTYRFQ